MKGEEHANKRKPELVDPQILCCEYFPDVPSVKTLAYSFYVLPLETTGKDVHIAFHQENNTKNKQKPSRCVAGKSHSSETVAAERESCVTLLHLSHRFSLLQYLP